MAKKTVRVKIPINRPEQLIKLARQVLEKLQKSLPKELEGRVEVQVFKEVLEKAISFRDSSKAHRAKAEADMQVANQALGTAEAQTVNTKNTIYFFLTLIRDILLIIHRDNEEALGRYGYDVVVGSSVPGRKKKKKANDE